MFEELFGDLDSTISGFVESDVFQVGLRVLVIYFVLIWLASAFWAYRDMRLRSASAVAPYIAAATIIIFTPIFFLFGLLLYRIVRPKETIAEVNERSLAEEAMLAEVASHSHCANCSRPVHEDWIICPTCRNRLRRVCPNCEHLIELDWTLCAWCGKDFERAEAPGTAAFMPTARPAQRQLPAAPPRATPLQGPRVPPPPATAPKPGTAASTASSGASGSPPTSGAGSSPTPPTQPQRGRVSPSSSPAPRSSQASSTARTTSGTQPTSGAQPSTGI